MSPPSTTARLLVLRAVADHTDKFGAGVEIALAPECDMSPVHVRRCLKALMANTVNDQHRPLVKLASARRDHLHHGGRGLDQRTRRGWAITTYGREELARQIDEQP